ncbi:hypothetical protein HIM_01178 [Hirsutella minnesotensis 3608]|nr:hypothetical protein HIM_01178 [Hirsutella minnesotensis 3608]
MDTQDLVHGPAGPATPLYGKNPCPSFLLAFILRPRPNFARHRSVPAATSDKTGAAQQRNVLDDFIDVRWSEMFSLMGTAKWPEERLWTRVPTETKSRGQVPRTIMKKIGESMGFFPFGNPWPIPEPRGRRRRVGPRLPDVAGEAPSPGGSPLSEEDMANMILAARLDVVNGLLTHSDAELKEEWSRLQEQTQAIPAKRVLDRKSRPEQHGRAGGHRLATLKQNWPLLAKGEQMPCRRLDENSARLILGMKVAVEEQVSSLETDAESETSSNDEQGSRDAGVASEESRDQADLSALDNSQVEAVASESENQAVESAQVDSTENPAPEAQATDGQQHISQVSTDSDNSNVLTNHPQLASPENKTSDTTSPMKREAQPASPVANRKSRLSETKIPLLPAAGHRVEPSPTKPLLPVSVPRKQQESHSADESTGQSSMFDFGPISRTFESPSTPVQPPPPPVRYYIAQRERELNRRKKESMTLTLQRYMARLQQRDRRPQTINHSSTLVTETSTTVAAGLNQAGHITVFTEENGLADELAQRTPTRPSPGPATPVPVESHLITGISAQHQQAIRLNTPHLPRDTIKDTMATPAVSWNAMTGHVAPVESTPYAIRPGNGTRSVNLQQRFDIFTGEQETPKQRHNSAISQLASMAADRCAGHAKVVIKQESDRLFVRFKLPVEYASQFPLSQGLDDGPSFTTPAARNESPYTSLHAPSLALAALQPSPGRSPNFTATNHDDTLVFPEFAPSPFANRIIATQGQSFDDKSAEAADLMSIASIDDGPAARHPRNISVSEDVDMMQLSSPDLHNHNVQDGQFRHFGERQTSHDLIDLASMDGIEQTSPVIVRENLQHMADVRMSSPRIPDIEMTGQTIVKRNVVMTNVPTAIPKPTPVTPTVQGVPRRQAQPLMGLIMVQPDVATGSTPKNVMASTNKQPSVGHGSAGPIQNRNAGTGISSHQTVNAFPTSPFTQRLEPRDFSSAYNGSPLVPAARRPPLGAKNPNTTSPQRSYHDGRTAEPVTQSPFKRGAAPTLPHQHLEARPQVDIDGDEEMEGAEPTRLHILTASSLVPRDEAMTDAPGPRRSKRINGNRKVDSPRSSIPRVVREVKQSESGRGVVGRQPARKSKTQVQTLAALTESNTILNKGDAVSPSERLARESGDEMDLDSEPETRGPGPKTRTGRHVTWKDAAVDEKPKGAGIPRPKATRGDTSVRKGRLETVASQRKRTTAMATGLAIAAKRASSRVATRAEAKTEAKTQARTEMRTETRTERITRASSRRDRF